MPHPRTKAMTYLALLTTGGISASVLAMPQVGVCCTEISNDDITHSETAQDDSFCKLVELDDNTLAVSAFRRDVGSATNAGAVFMFEYDTVNQTWSQTDILDIVSQVSSADDAFFGLCEFKDDTLVATAIVDSVNVLGQPIADVGAAFVFRRNSTTPQTWDFVQRLDMPLIDRHANARFGSDVALSGNRILVGTPLFDDPAVSGFEKSGRVYVYERPHSTGTWAYSGYIDDSASGEHFGASIDLDGDLAIIGSPGLIPGAGGSPGKGKARIYRKPQSAWVLEATVAGLGGSATDEFGRDVEIQTDSKNGNVAVVAAFRESPNSAVYVYRDAGSGSWSLEDRFERCDRDGVDLYGRRVALSGDTLLVSTRRDGTFVHQYSNGDWGFYGRLTSDEVDQPAAGFHAAIDGDRVVLSGLEWNVLPNDDKGAFFDLGDIVPTLSECICVGDINCDCTVDQTDLDLLLDAWGSCTGCPEDLDGDGDVDFSDMTILLANWGSCS